MALPVMSVVVLGAGILLGSSPVQMPPPEAHRASVQPAPRVSRVMVLSGGAGGDALFDDLRLRLPGVELAPQAPLAEPIAPGELTVFVSLRVATEHDGWELELITSDGRGFDRVLQMEPGWNAAERTRFAAANIAQLVEGVEAGTAVPDRQAVALPRADGGPTSRGAPEVILIPGVVRAPPSDPPIAAIERETEPDRRWMLGVTAATTAAVGLGRPNDRSRFTGGGGVFGATARAPSGVLLLTEVRGLRTASNAVGASLGRARVSLGSGFVLRTGTGGGELEFQGALSVEPWWVRRGGESVSVPGRAPAIGAWGRVVAGAVLRPHHAHLRIGGWMEVAGSGVAGDDGIRTAGISIDEETDGVTTRTPSFRVGGLEVSAGLQLQLAFRGGR